METKDLLIHTTNAEKKQIRTALDKAKGEPSLSEKSEEHYAYIDKLKETISAETEDLDKAIKTLLEEGRIYEPRPGALRYLG